MVEAHQRYRKINTFLRNLFGERVYRVGLRGGFGCPNRDGSRGTGGCSYCNPETNQPLGYYPGMNLSEQLSAGIEYVRRRHAAQSFIAFFSDYSATYADVRRLEALFREAIAYPGVVGLALGTRPDCLPEYVLDLLTALSRKTMLWVELGLQSSHDRTLERIRRGHSVEDSRKAIAALRERGLLVSCHVILGLPGETDVEMMSTASFLRETGVHGVKIHNLHVVRDTPLAEAYRRGDVELLDLPTYANLVTRFLEQLPTDMVVQRISGEAPRRLTVAPVWSVNKLAVLNAVERELVRRDTWQGRALGARPADLEAPVSWQASAGV
jgi:radical SAM protein (TIGR01212 family)